MFARMSEARKDALIELLDLQLVRRHSFFYKKGEHPSFVGILISGQLESIPDSRSPHQKTSRIPVGDLFGNNSVVWECPRTESVKSTRTTAVVLSLSAKDYNQYAGV